MFKKLLLTLGLILGSAGVASAQGYHYENTVVNQTGKPIPNAAVTVCGATATGTPCSPQVTVYSDIGLTIPKTQPIATGPLGNYDFYLAPNSAGYKISLTGASITGVNDLITIPCTSGSTCGGGGGGTNYQTVLENGVAQTVEPKINWIDGANIAIECVDNPGSTRTDCTIDAAAASGASLSADNLFTDNNRFKGPIPWIDATAYGAVSSLATSGVTCTTGSPNLTITNAFSAPFTFTGDWVNGQYISIYGCGATATVAAPNITPVNIISITRDGSTATATVASVGALDGGYLWVTGVTNATFNGLHYYTGGNLSTTITWSDAQAIATSSGGTVTGGFAIYEGTNPGATTYTYNACTVGHGGGCSAKSTAITVASAPATLTPMDAVFTNWGFDFPTGGDYYCIYRNNSFIGRSYGNGYKDDGVVWTRNSNCPAAPPAAATADTLVGRKILSGAGTPNLVMDGNASTSATNAYAFHDSAPAINAAVSAAITYNNVANGGPEVILPAGNYVISRVNLNQYKLSATGSIRLTTHPVTLTGESTLEGHGSLSSLPIIYNGDDQVQIITSDYLSGSIDGILFPGGAGGQTIRGADFNSLTWDVVMAANPVGGSNSITLENISGYHSTAGACILSDSNAIFVRLTNWRCNAASIGQGAATDRYSIYLSNTSGNVVDVVWDMKDIHMNQGSFWIDSPAPVVAGGITGMNFSRLSGFSSEEIHPHGLFNLDAGCTNSPYDIRVGMGKNIFEHVVGSDQAAYKGNYFFPRAGTTGCTLAQGADLVGSDTWILARGGDPTIGADIPFVASSLSVSLDGSLLDSDQDQNLRETRVGGKRTTIGGILYMRCLQGVNDLPCAALQITPADFTVSDGGAGAGCGAGLTYYFQVSESSGLGWTKVGMQVRERSASTGAGGEIIRITFAPGFIGPKYRVWFGTTSQAQTSYIETTNQSLDFVCQAATATGQTPPTSSDAYWSKLASESDVDSWIGIGAHDHLGIAKDPSTLDLLYALEVGAGGITSDSFYTAPKSAAPGGVANRSFLWDDTTDNRWKMNNNNGTSVDVAGLTEVPQLYNHSGTIQAAPHMVQDSCVLGTSCAVTLTGAAVFSSSTRYTCVVEDATGIFATSVAQASGSAFTITGTGTDTIRYVCVGN